MIAPFLALMAFTLALWVAANYVMRRLRKERDDARRRAEHWKARFGALREQVMLLPERDSVTGRYVHREH